MVLIRRRIRIRRLFVSAYVSLSVRYENCFHMFEPNGLIIIAFNFDIQKVIQGFPKKTHVFQHHKLFLINSEKLEKVRQSKISTLNILSIGFFYGKPCIFFKGSASQLNKLVLKDSPDKYKNSVVLIFFPGLVINTSIHIDRNHSLQLATTRCI